MPFLTNANNLTLYIYPNFVVLYSKKEGLDVIDLNDIDIKCNYMNFVESQSVPSDSQILYYTWDKVNKDGSRDKRFKNNYQIPVVEYGEIYIRSKNGINECYHISNYNKAVKFVKKFNTYKSEMKKCGH